MTVLTVLTVLTAISAMTACAVSLMCVQEWVCDDGGIELREQMRQACCPIWRIIAPSMCNGSRLRWPRYDD